MPRIKEKLTTIQVKNLKVPGRYSDGGGLYIYVKSPDRRYWVFRYRDRVTGKHRDKGLGPLDDVSLKMARDKARSCRNSLRDHIDPIDKDKQERMDAIIERSRQISFGECAKRYIEAHRADWHNKKHASQWTSTIETYCEPILSLSVADVDTRLVLQCIEPIWSTKTVTATRVRQRIESVLDWATVRKYRAGENPARWKGHLNKLLAMPSKLKKVKHLPALDYKKMGEFMAKLRKLDDLAARALELQILTATRPGEVVGSSWDEFNLQDALWTIPAERMKAGKEHHVPLSKQAVELMNTLPKGDDFVFTGISTGRHLTTEVELKCLKSIEPNVTSHGFRSTFRDWAADCTNHQREVCEHALAHQLQDKAEAAYSRSSQLAKRERLMTDWANFCDIEGTTDTNKVTPIRGRQGA